MKWLTNIYNPDANDASLYHLYSCEANTYERRKQEWLDYMRWLSDKFIGLPLGNENYTVKQLQEMNIVGVYKNEQS